MTNNAKGLALTSLGVFIMSLESLFIKFTTISPFLFSFYIGIFMFISMISTFIFKEKAVLKKALTTNLPMMIVCAILMGTSNIFFITAVKTTTVANVVIIFSTSALFTALIAFLLFKERPRKNVFIASFFMFIGLFIIFNDNLGIGSMEGNIMRYYVRYFFLFLLFYYQDLKR